MSSRPSEAKPAPKPSSKPKVESKNPPEGRRKRGLLSSLVQSVRTSGDRASSSARREPTGMIADSGQQKLTQRREAQAQCAKLCADPNGTYYYFPASTGGTMRYFIEEAAEENGLIYAYVGEEEKRPVIYKPENPPPEVTQRAAQEADLEREMKERREAEITAAEDAVRVAKELESIVPKSAPARGVETVVRERYYDKRTIAQIQADEGIVELASAGEKRAAAEDQSILAKKPRSEFL